MRCNPQVCSTHSLSLCQGTLCFGLLPTPPSSYMGELPNSHGWTLTNKSYAIHSIRPGLAIPLFIMGPQIKQFEILPAVQCSGAGWQTCIRFKYENREEQAFKEEKNCGAWDRNRTGTVGDHRGSSSRFQAFPFHHSTLLDYT